MTWITRAGYARSMATSRIAHSWRFESFGRRSWIRRPLLLTNPQHISIGARTFIRDGARLETVQRPSAVPHGRIVIGDRVGIEQGVHIASADLVEIASDVTLGPRVVILAAEHQIELSEGARYSSLSSDPNRITIGARAFIGANCVVLGTVSIGANAVIGANSVVTRDIPANCVAAGAPAKVLRLLDQA